MFTHTGKLLDYDQHATLLLFAETNYDSQLVSASARRTRKTHNTELGSSDFAIDSLPEVTKDVDYDIDAHATTSLANMTNCGNPKPDSYLPLEDCSSLTPEERDA